MQAWFESLLASLLAALALPQFGLSTVFVVALVSATLLPLGSEPAVFGLVKLEPSLFWPAILVATAGNTAGGAITWWMGYGAEVAYERVTHHKPHENRALQLLHRFGAKACLLSWLPIVGDPLCAVAGWLRLPFWPCVAYMAVGKFARYLTMTAALLWVFPGRYEPPPERLTPLPPQGGATSGPAEPDPRLPLGVPALRAASCAAVAVPPCGAFASRAISGPAEPDPGLPLGVPALREASLERGTQSGPRLTGPPVVKS